MDTARTNKGALSAKHTFFYFLFYIFILTSFYKYLQFPEAELPELPEMPSSTLSPKIYLLYRLILAPGRLHFLRRPDSSENAIVCLPKSGLTIEVS
jgi:hypothetical protein